MPSFSYDGLDKDNNRIRGVVEEVSKNSALSKLSSEGILVSFISEESVKKRKRIVSVFKKKGLADIFFQLSILTSSGIPLTKALTVTAGSTKDSKLKNILMSVQDGVESGRRFSDSLADYKEIFGELYIHLIRTSEKVGRLSSVLLDISKFEEEKQKAGDKVASAMLYPSVVLMLGFGVVGFMLTFVVPKLENIFRSAGAEIPTSTKSLLFIAGFLQDYGMFIFISFLVLAVVLRRLYSAKGNFRMKFDRWLYRFAMVRDMSASRLSHVLAFQLKEGLPLVEALNNAGDGLKNIYVRESVMEIAERVKGGEKFSTVVADAGIFSELFSAAASTGEKSGNMAELLDRVNTYYDRKSEQLVSRFTSVIEPLFIMFIGLMVGFIVISIMEPLFSINSLVK